MYTSKIKTPVYKMKGDRPKLNELVDGETYKKLVANIEQSNIPNGLKTFLKAAATRHFKFNYDKIAEYYAHASKDVQELFEESGLVIVDFDSAIENGFVQMNKRLMEIRKNEAQE